MSDTPRNLAPHSATFTWFASGALEPSDVTDVMDRLFHYSHDALPGSQIVHMTYDGNKLQITMRET